MSPRAKAATPKVSRYVEAVGRRKTAIARVRVTEDKKKQFTINGLDYLKYLPTAEYVMTVLVAQKAVGKDEISVSAMVHGGGKAAQAEAIRHGIARVLIKMNPDFRPTLRALGYLTRDPRAKERKKPGLKRARRAPQWAKR